MRLSERILTLAFLVLSLISPTRGQSPGREFDLDEFITRKEKFVRHLAERAEELYATRGEIVESCECSKHACSDDFQDVSCVDYLGQYPGCDMPNRHVDLDNSVCETPPGMDVKMMSDEVKESICVYRGIEDFIRESDERESAWTYLGM